MAADELGAFLARHALSEFRHKERLLSALGDGTCRIREVPLRLQESVPVGELIALYRSRIPAGDGAYARSIREDWAAVLRALEKHPRQHPVRIIRFDMVPGFVFGVLECAQDRAVLGCVLDVDLKQTDVETWERFFG